MVNIADPPPFAGVNPPITCSAVQLFYCSNAQPSPFPLYNCREPSTNRPYYAKQTQFQNRRNERKLIVNNGLRKYIQLETW